MVVSRADPDQGFPTFPGDTVRARLANALRYDLLGPEKENEVLTQSPATRYLVGMLAPRDTEVDATEDEQLDTTSDIGEPSDAPPPVSILLAPSSIGLSFVVPRSLREVDVEVSWGDYAKQERAGEISAVESQSIDKDELPDLTSNTKRKQYEWHRIPRRSRITIGVAIEGRATPIDAGSGVQIDWMVRSMGNKSVVSVFLVNARKGPAGRRPPDELWIYQPKVRVTGQGAPFLARQLEREIADSDPDLASADLVYRNRLEFATGHSVAANWSLGGNPNRADAVWTEVIPEHEVPVVKPTGPGELPGLNMDRLAAVSHPSELKDLLGPLLNDYEAWIELRRKEAEDLKPEISRPVARDHVDAALRSLERIRGGLAVLESNQAAFEAFKFANLAMSLQLEVTVRIRALRRGQPVPRVIRREWRPFQIAFIIQALKGLVEPTAEERDMVDLLWFPTGGGKTEAYLGLTAFVLAFRRLRAGPSVFDSSAGTAVLMRYTLRLLTIQQFQRATALICACEVIRTQNTLVWGSEMFAIGLWVGGSVTPNQYADAKAALERLKNGEVLYEGSPYQLLFCPWCGTDLTPGDYVSDDDLERTLIKCPNAECQFFAGGSEFGLPVLLVDQEIYRNPPSVILATVDKFAQMAWNGRIQALFGRVEDRCARHGFISAGESHPRKHEETRGWPKATVQPMLAPLAPPDLIIQDELHLISGPLGTLVGIYETAVDGLSSYTVGKQRIRPKVIASTATIRRASRQIRALFGRDVAVFPPQGLDVDDSFFARQDSASPGRQYLGIYAPGKSVKTSLVRVYGALLSRAEEEFRRDPTPEADAYMTLVGYFNSLRELGGALRLVDDDVRARLRVLRKRGFGPARTIYEQHELTSRARSFQITDTLKRLDLSFFERTSGRYPIDVLLASNMLSVGVDIDRLGLMVVSAQPKTTAEYIQATSRVGRVYPGLVVEVYNWVRPRDTSHYERFVHYHDTFYRHVEASSVTPFSARARDRALPGVLVSYVRLDDIRLATEQDANAFDPLTESVRRITHEMVSRAGLVTERPDIEAETNQQVKNLTAEWHKLVSPPAKRGLVYTGRGLKKDDVSKSILLRSMEMGGGRGMWKAAGSLREVESEVDIVLVDNPSGGQ